MAKKKIRVCIVIPAFNEAPVIAKVLAALPSRHEAKNTIVIFDKLVVDDGSRDATARQAQGVAGTLLAQHIINMGAGGATRTGLHYAAAHGYDLALTVDADGQHAPEDVRTLVGYMVEHPDVDLLIGNRLHDAGDMPVLKKIGNMGLSWVTLIILGTYVADSQSGLRAFSKRALANLQYHSNNYTFCSEMIWQARRADLRVAEYPIKAIYTEYSKSKLSGQKTFSAGLKILQQLISRRLMDILHE